MVVSFVCVLRRCLQVAGFAHTGQIPRGRDAACDPELGPKILCNGHTLQRASPFEIACPVTRLSRAEGCTSTKRKMLNVGITQPTWTNRVIILLGVTLHIQCFKRKCKCIYSPM
jgi:hypothetical protein